MPEAHHWYAYLLALTGRLDETIQHSRRSVDLDPLAAVSYVALAANLTIAGRYDESLAAARRAVELAPQFGAQRAVGLALLLAGKDTEALDALNSAAAASNRHPWVVSELAYVHARIGDVARALQLRDELLERRKAGYIQAFTIAVAEGAVRRLDEAFEWLRVAEDERDPLPFLTHWPAAESFRHDPRWDIIAGRTWPVEKPTG
jgi:tetratricopeptide (TPR) repeat protein